MAYLLTCVQSEYPESANISQFEPVGVPYNTYSDAPRLSRPMTPTVCQQPGFTAPSTPRGSTLHNQNYSAPSTPSSCLARQQNLMATMSQANDVNRQSDVYLPSSVPHSGMIQHTDQKNAGYSFTPSAVGNVARQQEVVSGMSNYDYVNRCGGIVAPSGPIMPRSDIATPLPPSGAVMNVNLKLEGSGPVVSSGSMAHSQESSVAFIGSDPVDRHQEQVVPLTTSGSMGYHNDYMPPFVSSGSTGRHQDTMDQVNSSAVNMRNQQLVHPSNRCQMSDSMFLTRSSSGRCLSRGDDIHYEHSGLDLDLPYHDNALFSRRQNNERLVHSLPTSPRKVMQPSVHGNIMSPLYLGSNTIGSYSNSEYNLEKTNKSKVLPKEVSVKLWS
jgi:hypothetical protein